MFLENVHVFVQLQSAKHEIRELKNIQLESFIF